MSLVLPTAGALTVAFGSRTTVAAVDDVDTGLREVLFAFAVLESDPVLTVDRASASLANQVTSPGHININTWMPTGATNPTPIAATTFSKVVHWMAVGK